MCRTGVSVFFNGPLDRAFRPVKIERSPDVLPAERP
jgi:hypothetical protein